MCSVSNYPRYGLAPFWHCFELVREDPEPVPEIVPYGKESSGYELAEVWCYARLFQVINYEVVQYEIDQSYYHVAPGHLCLVAGELRILKNPVSLQKVIHRPACESGYGLGPKERAAENFIDKPESTVARPEVRAAAKHILTYSGYFGFLFLFGHFVSYQSDYNTGIIALNDVTARNSSLEHR